MAPWKDETSYEHGTEVDTCGTSIATDTTFKTLQFEGMHAQQVEGGVRILKRIRTSHCVVAFQLKKMPYDTTCALNGTTEDCRERRVPL